MLDRAAKALWIRMCRETRRGHGTDVNEPVHGVSEAGESVIVRKLVRTRRVFVHCGRAKHVCPSLRTQSNPLEVLLPVLALGGDDFGVQLDGVPDRTRISMEIFPSE